jgi:hypothetical protein
VAKTNLCPRCPEEECVQYPIKLRRTCPHYPFNRMSRKAKRCPTCGGQLNSVLKRQWGFKPNRTNQYRWARRLPRPRRGCGLPPRGGLAHAIRWKITLGSKRLRNESPGVEFMCASSAQTAFIKYEKGVPTSGICRTCAFKTGMPFDFSKGGR